MSLTSQLYRGELGKWCARNLRTENLIADVARHLRMAGNPEPVRPSGKVEAGHWAAVGGAFGARLALLVDGAPPYYALLGAVRAGLAGRAWCEQAHLLFPTHREFPTDSAARWSQYRPGSRGWIDMGGTIDPGQPTGHEPVLTDFLRRTVAVLEEHAPPGALGSPGVEASLARSCWVISGWESSYRGGRLPDDLAAAHAQPGYDATTLRQVITEPVLAEMVELARVLHTSRTIERWRGPSGAGADGPLGISGPVIVPHWADGDLVIGGGTLLDVKTAVRVDQDDTVSRWLWQILAYLWLDTQDLYELTSVGLYLARHGVTVSWGSDAFLSSLLGGNGRDDAAREQFLQLAARVIREEGGHPPAPWKRRTTRRLGDG
ncbi:hypothetical protein [Amycolatopsis sp. NPDC059657]|uniref:hypothetical protein n=1 Tax=Amycolatopsis sp. NPDC059657 TaxID=3346899 RepID=UPI00366BA2AD